MTRHALLFDLDDTLYDEITFVHAAMLEVAEFVARRSDHAPDEVHRHLLDELGRSGRGRVFDAVLERLRLPASWVPTLVYVYRSAEPRLSLLPGATDLLRRCRDAGLATGILTDGSSLVQAAKIRSLGLRNLVDAVVLTDSVGAGEPKPSVVGFEVAMRLLDTTPGATGYVANDVNKDFVASQVLGMTGVLVRRGQIGDLAAMPATHHPDLQVHDLTQVWDALPSRFTGGGE